MGAGSLAGGGVVAVISGAGAVSGAGVLSTGVVAAGGGAEGSVGAA